MILNDLEKEYRFLLENIADNIEFISACHTMAERYARFEFVTNLSEKIHIDSEFKNKALSDLFPSIAEINSSIHKSYEYMLAMRSQELSDLSRSEFDQASKLFDQIVDLTNEIIMDKMENTFDVTIVNRLNNCVTNYLSLVDTISVKYNFLIKLEKVFFEPLPENISEESLISLEIRSDKKNIDVSSYAQDLTLISQFITRIESLLDPEVPVYTRRIESGSLRIVWSGGTVEISCISDIINAIISGIRSLAFLPSDIRMRKQEAEKAELENETLRTENTSRKLAIINSQIDIIAEKLGLDKNNPEDVEKIQQLCLPLIGYLENNPVGHINGTEYDINEKIRLLTFKDFDMDSI